MSKLLLLNIKVHCDQNGQPLQLSKEQQWIGVTKILEYWHDTGCWWSGEKEKSFYRLSLQDGGICEIFKDLSGSQWFLYKIYD